MHLERGTPKLWRGTLHLVSPLFSKRFDWVSEISMSWIESMKIKPLVDLTPPDPWVFIEKTDPPVGQRFSRQIFRQTF